MGAQMTTEVVVRPVVVLRVALVVSPLLVTTSSVQVGRDRDPLVEWVAMVEMSQRVATEVAVDSSVTTRATVATTRMAAVTMTI